LPSTIFTSFLDFAVTCAVLVVAQIVYVMFGFGSGLIAVGGLALLFPEIQDVVVLLLLVNLPAELWVCWQSRREIRWRPIVWLGTGIGVGIPLGAIALKQGDPRFILVILGWFLMAVGLVFLRLPSGGRFHPPVWAAPPAGLVSGMLTGLFGTGGPPLIIWYHLTSAGKGAFRGNLMTIFLLMTAVRVPSYVAGGLVTAPRLWSTAAVLPAVFLGAWLGHRLHIRISEVTFRRLVSGLLFVLGLAQVVR
jgi:uncharacterized membrane protein YfcA